MKDAAALMKSAGEDVLQKWPVSKRVNSSRASDDDATLIDEINYPFIGRCAEQYDGEKIWHRRRGGK